MQVLKKSCRLVNTNRRKREPLLGVPKTPSVFHPHAHTNALRRRGVCGSAIRDEVRRREDKRHLYLISEMLPFGHCVGHLRAAFEIRGE